MYLKRNDLVVVISGAEKGKQGRIMRVLTDDRVIIQGINLRYKHLKRSQKHPQGARIQRECPVQASKVQLVDPKTNRPTRVGFRIEGGRKVRFAKRSGEKV